MWCIYCVCGCGLSKHKVKTTALKQTYLYFGAYQSKIYVILCKFKLNLICLLNVYLKKCTLQYGVCLSLNTLNIMLPGKRDKCQGLRPPAPRSQGEKEGRKEADHCLLLPSASYCIQMYAEKVVTEGKMGELTRYRHCCSCSRSPHPSLHTHTHAQIKMLCWSCCLFSVFWTRHQSTRQLNINWFVQSWLVVSLMFTGFIFEAWKAYTETGCNIVSSNKI